MSNPNPGGFAKDVFDLARKVLAGRDSFVRSTLGQNNDGQMLREYLYCHRVLTLFAQTLIAEKSGLNSHGPSEYPEDLKREVSPSEYADRLRLARGTIKPDDILSIYETKTHISGYRGKLHPIHLLHISCTDKKKDCWIARADVDYEGGKLVSYREPVVIRQNAKGHYARTSSGVTVDDAITFGDHQLFALIAIENALLSGKHDQAIVFATGTGKSYVLLAPAIATGKGGVFCVPNMMQRNQLIDDILTLDKNIKRDSILTNEDVAVGDEASTLLRHVEGEIKYLVLEHADIKRFSSADPTQAYRTNPRYKEVTPKDLEAMVRKIPYFIDEVHEVAPDVIAHLLEQGNRVLAVTATWTNDLQKLFGDPMAQLDMHYALNELRAFRPIRTNVKQFEATHSTADQVFEILADYFGRIAFIQEDNTPESGDKYITHASVQTRPNLLDLGYERLVSMIMETTEVRRYDSMNMAFTKDYSLMVAIKEGYQGVFSGSYPRLSELANHVSEMRAEARIRQLWTVENQLFGVTGPNSSVPAIINLADPKIIGRFGKIIDHSFVTASRLMEDSGLTLQSRIADVMTRRISGLFLNDTPPGLIRADQVSGKLQQKLKDLSDPSLKLDSEQIHLLTNLAEGDSNIIFRRISNVLSPLRPPVRDIVLENLKRGNVTALIIKPEQIDLAGFSSASYSVLVEPGDSKGAAQIAQRLNEGTIIHVAGDSELATGYSSADIKSIQRLIGEVIPVGVIRATQILGRAIRGKDGLAFASDYIGPRLDLTAPLGTRGGRPFGLEDVMAVDYAERVRTYDRNSVTSASSPTLG